MEKPSNQAIELNQIELNQVPIRWDLDAGRMSFFDIPAVTFWLNPSLLRILQPLRDEVGDALYRLLVAHQSSLGTEEDYHQMVTQLGGDFEEGFLAWGAAVSAAGWGHFELLEFDKTHCKAVVRVSNPWELQMLESQADTWGCPFMLGKIIGIFSHALGETCWADEKNIIIDQGASSIEFHIHASEMSIEQELEKLHALRRETREAQLQEEIRQHQLAEDALRNLAVNFAAVSGTEFFAKVTSHLARALNLDYVFIAELLAEKDRANVVGGYAKGEAMALPFAYDLADTPCEQVAGQSFCFHQSGVQEKFPKATLLRELDVDCYIGVPLFDRGGDALGLIVGLNSTPADNPDRVESLIDIFSSRVAVEIERKQAEDKLKRSEIQYRTLFESSTDAIMILDETGLIDCNQAALDMFGWGSRKEFHDQHPADFSPPTQSCGTDSRALVDAYIATAFRDGRHQFEWMHKRMDGSVFPAEVWLTAMELDGKPVLQATVRDISGRKEAEEALQNSEANYRRLVEFSPEPICVHSEGKFVYVNAAGIKLLGGSGPEELLGKPVTDIVHPDYRGQVQARIRLQEHTDQPSPLIEEKLLKMDGTIIDGEVTGMPIVYHGKPASMVLFRDISARKKNEMELRKLSSAIEQAGESIVITDRNGIIEYINPAFEKITGYSTAEAIGQTPRMLKSGNQDAAFYEKMWKTIADGVAWHGKVIDRRKDGSFFPAMLTISPIMDEHGEITNFVGTHADLTEQENLEQQFHQAQKMEAIGTMVGGIAHNFNNMLAGMTGNLYLAKQRVKGDANLTQKLANVENLSMRAADLIEQLLTFARKGIVCMKEMPLTPFFKEMMQFLRTSLPENIAVHQDICTDDLPSSASHKFCTLNWLFNIFKLG